MNQDFKNALWGTANTLRGSVDPSEYKYPVLGLIFLKYASEAFAARRNALEKAFADPNDDLYLKDPDTRVSFLEDHNYYVMENVLWVPERARWLFIQNNAKQPNIAVLLDEAMGLIEANNPKLDGLLPKVYVRTVLEQNTLGSLIDLVASINFDAKDGGDVLPGLLHGRDLLGDAVLLGLEGVGLADERPALDVQLQDAGDLRLRVAALGGQAVDHLAAVFTDHADVKHRYFPFFIRLSASQISSRSALSLYSTVSRPFLPCERMVMRCEVAEAMSCSSWRM